MATKPSYERASDYAKGIGESLDKVAGHDMLLHDYSISERPMRGEDKDFVEIWLSTLDDADTKVMFHAWSQSLAEKLREIPADKLPVIIKFVRVPTAGGFRVWTFE